MVKVIKANKTEEEEEEEEEEEVDVDCACRRSMCQCVATSANLDSVGPARTAVAHHVAHLASRTLPSIDHGEKRNWDRKTLFFLSVTGTTISKNEEPETIFLNAETGRKGTGTEKRYFLSGTGTSTSKNEEPETIFLNAETGRKGTGTEKTLFLSGTGTTISKNEEPETIFLNAKNGKRSFPRRRTVTGPFNFNSRSSRFRKACEVLPGGAREVPRAPRETYDLEVLTLPAAKRPIRQRCSSPVAFTMEKPTAPFSLEGKRWRYRGEGNANLVVSLTENRQIVRFRKDPEPIEMDAKAQVDGESGENVRVWREAMFCGSIMGTLLGGCYVGNPIAGKIDSDEIKKIHDELEPMRPDYRHHKGLYCGHVMVYPDYAVLPYSLSPLAAQPAPFRPTFCVEVKPKQGWLPEIDRMTKCTYCLNQFLKLKNGYIQTRSKYCPLDLFSGIRTRMKKAIYALLEDPQNNLKLFQDGVLVYGEELRPELGLILRRWFPDGPYNKTRLEEKLVNLVVEALSRNLSVSHHPPSQRWNMSTDGTPQPLVPDANPDECLPAHLIQAVEAKLQEKPCDWTTTPLPQDCILQRILAVQRLETSGSARVYHLYLLDRYREHHEYAYCSRLLLAREFSAVERYLLATTAKDCSVMMAFQRLSLSAAEDALPPAQHIVHDTDGSPHVLNIGVSDLDPKPMSCIKKHRKRDLDTLLAVLEWIERRDTEEGPAVDVRNGQWRAGRATAARLARETEDKAARQCREVEDDAAWLVWVEAARQVRKVEDDAARQCRELETARLAWEAAEAARLVREVEDDEAWLVREVEVAHQVRELDAARLAQEAAEVARQVPEVEDEAARIFRKVEDDAAWLVWAEAARQVRKVKDDAARQCRELETARLAREVAEADRLIREMEDDAARQVREAEDNAARLAREMEDDAVRQCRELETARLGWEAAEAARLVREMEDDEAWLVREVEVAHQVRELEAARLAQEAAEAARQVPEAEDDAARQVRELEAARLAREAVEEARQVPEVEDEAALLIWEVEDDAPWMVWVEAERRVREMEDDAARQCRELEAARLARKAAEGACQVRKLEDEAARLVRKVENDAMRLVRELEDEAARLVREVEAEAARLVRKVEDDAMRLVREVEAGRLAQEEEYEANRRFWDVESNVARQCRKLEAARLALEAAVAARQVPQLEDDAACLVREVESARLAREAKDEAACLVREVEDEASRQVREAEADAAWLIREVEAARLAWEVEDKAARQVQEVEDEASRQVQEAEADAAWLIREVEAACLAWEVEDEAARQVQEVEDEASHQVQELVAARMAREAKEEAARLARADKQEQEEVEGENKD